MSSTGTLQVDALFKGLTRPATIFGVSYTLAAFNMVATVILYIVTTRLTVLFFLGPGLHLIGYVITFNEPLFLELFLVRTQKCVKCKNKDYHGANSYDVT